MQRSASSGKKLLSIGEASEYLGVSIDTLRRWEKKGRIEPRRSPGGHRYFDKKDLDDLFGQRYTRDEETQRRKTKKKKLGLSPEKKSEEKKETSKVEITYQERSELIILDRHVREFDIPQVNPIRIIQDKPLLSPYEAYISQQNVSVLTPPQVIETQQNNQPKPNTTQIIIFVLILFFILAVFFVIWLWSTSGKVLSPIP